MAPLARRANFTVSFWASDNLKQRQLGCWVELSRSRTSWSYLAKMATVSLLVSMMSPNMVCFGPIISSNHLSMARGHCLTKTLGSLITAKMELIIAAKTIFMWSTSRTNIKASLTYIRAGRSIWFPASSIPDGTRKYRSEFGRRINLFPLQYFYEFLVLYDQIGSVSKNICENFDGLPECLPNWCWRFWRKYHCRGKVMQLTCYENKGSS